MFVALTTGGERVIAWETAKNDAGFSCPQCESQVILKKGSIYVHHFAHIPGSECPNAGESMQHMMIKKALYLSLKDAKGCRKCAMERRLEAVRPDVSLWINETPVAIEVQLSSITETEINRRLLRYTDLGIYCLWVFARNDLIPDRKAEREAGYIHGDPATEDRYMKTTKKWERAVHALYGGRVYYWQNGAQVLPVHFYFGSYKRDARFDFLSARYRGRKTGTKQTLHIAWHFERYDTLVGGSGGVPVLIWHDRKADWWKESA